MYVGGGIFGEEQLKPNIFGTRVTPKVFLFFLLGKENWIEFPTVGKDNSNEFPN